MPNRSRGTPKPTTTQRGLGYEHRENRDRLLRRHINGTRCWWCGKPMHREKGKNWDGESLHADHTLPRSHGGKVADRLLHGSCNRDRKDGRKDDQRPAAQPQQTTPDPLGDTQMGWPW